MHKKKVVPGAGRYLPTHASRPLRGITGDADLSLHLRYGFESGEQRGPRSAIRFSRFSRPVLESGSIRHAAQVLGCSYRYVWGSLKKWEEELGERSLCGRRANADVLPSLPNDFCGQNVVPARACSRISKHCEMTSREFSPRPATNGTNCSPSGRATT